MVGAPPSSIGKFGADADNWIDSPRHTEISLYSNLMLVKETVNLLQPSRRQRSFESKKASHILIS